MEQKIICSINGVGIYGVISICIFFTFFTGMLIWAFCRKKTYLDKMGALPLEQNDQQSNDNLHS